VNLAIAAHRAGVTCKIVAKCIAALWHVLTGVPETDWVEAIDIPGPMSTVSTVHS
jgi:hypothetical protein